MLVGRGSSATLGVTAMTRLERWVTASQVTEGFEPFMIVAVQGLGRLDVSLLGEDSAFVEAHERNAISIDQHIRLTDRFTLSYLWVLGAYEVVRTICQRINERRDLVSGDVARQFKAVKRRISRLRMPLAKMEPASAHKSDSHIAYPAMHRSLGIAWQLSPQDFITRAELADALLSALEAANTKIHGPCQAK